MKLVRALFCLATALMLSSPAAAQEYPTRPIRFIVPFPPSGSADILARLIADKLMATLGQPLVIENRPGAGGALGADIVAKGPADGHMLLYANTSLAINPSLYKSLPYDTAKAFAPVINMVFIPNFILVAEGVPANSIADLVKLAKASPGKLNYSSPGNGTFPHLAIELFKLHAGISLVHIPYKGAAAALQALVAKEVEVLSNDLLTALPHVKTGRIKALAITGVTRSSAAPDVPTMAEAGLKDYSAVGWQGIMVAAGTPAPIIARLNAEIGKVLADPALRERFASQGLEIVGGTPQQFGNFIRRDTEKWREAVTASGAKLD
jgi:tripartite-type tricarboxylate transporter receptor subunit TctC